MATIRRFEDLKAWKQARILARALYQISRKVETARDFALLFQLRKTALSPGSNIAEGFGRRSDRDFANFLSIAHGSVAEAQSLLYNSLDENYIDQSEFDRVYREAESCSRLIQRLGQYLAKRKSAGAKKSPPADSLDPETPETPETP